MSDVVATYQRERVRARRRTTLRLAWQARARRRRNGPVDDRTRARLQAVRRELAARGRVPAPWPGG